MSRTLPPEPRSMYMILTGPRLYAVARALWFLGVALLVYWMVFPFCYFITFPGAFGGAIRDALWWPQDHLGLPVPEGIVFALGGWNIWGGTLVLTLLYLDVFFTACALTRYHARLLLRRQSTTRHLRWLASAYVGVMSAMLAFGIFATVCEASGQWQRWMLDDLQPRYWAAFLSTLAAGVLFTAVAAWLKLAAPTRRAWMHNTLLAMSAGLIGASVLLTKSFHQYLGPLFFFSRFTVLSEQGTYPGLLLGSTVFLWAWADALAWWSPRLRHRMNRALCLACGYDLCGTIAVGNRTCPECGMAITGEQPAPIA